MYNNSHERLAMSKFTTDPKKLKCRHMPVVQAGQERLMYPLPNHEDLTHKLNNFATMRPVRATFMLVTGHGLDLLRVECITRARRDVVRIYRADAGELYISADYYMDEKYRSITAAKIMVKIHYLNQRLK